MDKNNKIILGIILLLIIGGIVLVYSLNSSNIGTNNSSISNNSQDNLNDSNNISNMNSSSDVKNNYADIGNVSKGNYSVDSNKSYPDDSKYSHSVRNKNIVDNKNNIKNIANSSNNQTSILTKKEAYEIAEKAINKYNPEDTSYKILYSKAKYYEQPGLKYWKFPVYNKNAKEVGSYISVDIETKGNWGENAQGL